MSRPNAYKMYQELAAYYAVERGSKSVSEWQTAIKKAAGGEKDSVEVLYDRWKESIKPKVEPAPTTAAVTPVVEIIPPRSPSPPDKPVAQRPDAHQVVHVHTAPDTVDYRTRVAHDLATRAASWAQTLALGVVVGVLVSKHVLKIMGL